MASPTSALLAQADTAKIAQVKAGAIKMAHASWWGFDKEDSTEALQNAINSGVPKLIVDNTGSDWIINKPINLISNQEIVFQDGVVVQAKEGAFKGRTDSLFMAKERSNLSLIGEGKVIFRMRRDDYDNPSLYQKAEWRHGISLWECEDVIIRNLTVRETGGDGLYLGAGSKGYNKNILVEDCIFDSNYRQGISVISAEDFTVRRSKLINTKGTNPQFGIDYEPNTSTQRIVNCVLEDVEFYGNAGGGLDVYTVNLTDKSLPVSIMVNRCTFAESSRAVLSTITKSATAPVTANITFDDCTFKNSRTFLRNSLEGSANYMFKNCTFDFISNPGEKIEEWKQNPLTFNTDQAMEEQFVGGVTFDNTLIKTNQNLAPVKFNFQTTGQIANTITGDLIVEKEGEITPFDLEDLIKQEQDRLAVINALTPAKIDFSKLHASAARQAHRQGNNGFYTRGAFTFLQNAQSGQNIDITVTVQKSYGGEVKIEQSDPNLPGGGSNVVRRHTVTLELQDPNGKKLQEYVISDDNKPFPVTFTAEMDGIYRLVRTQTYSARVDINSSHPGSGFLIESGMEFLPARGKLYFEVPVGVEDFIIGVKSAPQARVTLRNSQGKEVKTRDVIDTLELFTGNRADASQPEIWSIEVSQVVWAVAIHFYGSLQPVVSTNPTTLLRSQ